MQKIKKTTIQIGLEKPLKIHHMTDSHLPFYCESDSENMIRQGKKEDMAYRLNSMKEIGGYPVNIFFNSRIYEKELMKGTRDVVISGGILFQLQKTSAAKGTAEVI